MDQSWLTVGGANGVRVLDERGVFTEPVDVRWGSGLFRLEASGRAAVPTAPRPTRPEAPSLWLIPGLVDAHAHLAWHAFNAEDRDELSEDARHQLTQAALRQNLAAGFTSIRDAGGLTPARVAQPTNAPTPRVQCAGTLIDRAAAEAAGGLDRAVEGVLAAGSLWIKLVATASVTSPPGATLEPVFTAAEMRDAVRRAQTAGAGVMAHAWGGPAIDDAIEAGAMSIEHGIFLTDAQARSAAARGMTLVPTLRIYREVEAMIRQGSLPAAFRARVDEAVAAHPRAVQRARDAGLAIAVGTDSGTPEQHGSGVREIDAFTAAGLSPAEALLAATRGGAELLARVDTGAPSGLIADGEIADGVLLTCDPLGTDPLGSDLLVAGPGRPFAEAISAATIAAVIVGGRVLCGQGSLSTDLPTHELPNHTPRKDQR